MMLFRLALSVFSPLFRPSVVRSFVCLFVSLFELLALRGGSMPFLFLHPITTFSVSLLCARLHQTLASNQRPIAPVTLLALLFQFSFPRSDGSLCTRCTSHNVATSSPSLLERRKQHTVSPASRRRKEASRFSPLEQRLMPLSVFLHFFVSRSSLFFLRRKLKRQCDSRGAGYFLFFSVVGHV